jgi:hypothetical protein
LYSKLVDFHRNVLIFLLTQPQEAVTNRLIIV